MYCASMVSEQATLDANADHLCVLSNVISRIDNRRTPYLFSAITAGTRRIYLVRAEFVHLKDSVLKFKDTPNFLNVEENNVDSHVTTSFFIRLNPAIRRTLHSGRAGKKIDRVYAIKSSSDIEQWFIEKCQRIGISVMEFELLQQGVVYCSKGHTSINEAFVLVKACASVPDFQTFYEFGFGKRKGFGFGMPVFYGSKHFEIINSVLVAPFK